MGRRLIGLVNLTLQIEIYLLMGKGDAYGVLLGGKLGYTRV